MKYIFGVIFLLISFCISAQDNQNLVSIYNSDSSLIGTGVLRDGRMEGLWRFQNTKTNSLVQSITFSQGLREGLTTSFHPNSSKHIEAEYRSNRLNGFYKEYDRTGALKTEMVFNDSVTVGPYREYYAREGQPSYVNPKQVKVEGQFVNGKRHGKWVTFYNTGDLAVIQTYENGKVEGPHIEYDQDGGIILQVNYKNDVPNGQFTRFSFGGTVEETGDFVNGRRVGKWLTYFPGSKTIESEKYYDDLGNKTGEWKYFYENKRTARIEKYENDLPIGTWEEYFPNRALSKRKTYELGMPTGSYIENHANGNVSVQGQYLNGGKDGLWKSYFPEGTIYSIGEYKNDLKTGLWKYFNKIGILIAEGEYTLGSENGQWFYYYDGGQLKSVGSYFLGFEDGTWGLFYDNKQLTQEEYWTNGRLINVGDYFSYEGDKRLEKGTLKEGNGTRITYYTTGEKESEGNYINGKPEGNWIYFHETGKKASEGQMKDGKKEGPWKYYNVSGRLEQVINYKEDEIVIENQETNTSMFNF
jgi:antitoxin component YwqK of YwqJK toxin-antitoxin module